MGNCLSKDSEAEPGDDNVGANAVVEGADSSIPMDMNETNRDVTGPHAAAAAAERPSKRHEMEERRLTIEGAIAMGKQFSPEVTAILHP